MAGRVTIFLGQPHFVDGDLLAGSVVVDLGHTLNVHEIVFELEGKEEAFWEESKTTTDSEGHVKTETIHRHHKHCFIHEKIQLAGSGTLQSGSWSYPFTYRLPSGIPASFKEETTVGGHKVVGKIKYRAKAEVDAHHSKDLKTHVPVIIGRRISGPVGCVAKQNHKSCMFNKGSLALKVEANKDTYFPGEEAKLKVEILNESVKKVTGINVVLYRDLTLYAEGHRFNHREISAQTRAEGLNEATKDKRIIRFRIPDDYSELSSDSEVLKASYNIKVECDVPMAVDLDVHLPILFTVPQPHQRVQKQDIGQDAEIDLLAEQGQNFHETTPLILPEGTGECKCCSVM